jgi:hypothetical protein
MRRRADGLRPAVIEVALARTDWLEANHSAECAEASAAALGNVLESAQRAQDAGRVNEIEPLHDFAQMSARSLRTEANDARSVWTNLEEKLRQKAGPDGVITDVDIDCARRLADELDIDNVSALRQQVQQLDCELFRAETSAARSDKAERDPARHDARRPASPPKPYAHTVRLPESAAVPGRARAGQLLGQRAGQPGVSSLPPA